MNLNELGNGKVEGFALIKKIEVRTSTKGAKYLDLLIGDATGEMIAKYWDYEEGVTPNFKANTVVKVRGQLNEFRGATQLRIELIRETVPSDNVNLNDYVRSTEYTPEEMYNRIIDTVYNFKDEELKQIVLTIYEENRVKLLTFPAAIRMHHAVRGGLLYHTLSIIEMAKKTAEIYPMVDSDLLIAGAALHDIAKTREMAANELGIATEYTTDGNLVGHLIRGAMMVRACGEKLNISEEKIVLLEHMLISHHGIPEYGSPIRPMFLEAMILNTLDELDAKMYEFTEISSGLEPHTFSDRHRMLDDRRIYNHGRRDDLHPKANLMGE